MPPLANAHALAVGIANYESAPALPENVLWDAQDLHAVLTDPDLCAYAPEKARLLLDSEATAVGMRQALRDLAKRADDESTVTIYFSGHGGRLAQGPHRGEYILPVDARYRPGDLAALAGSAIPSAEFTDLLRAIPARKMLVVLDCCHAGSVGYVKDAIDAATPEGMEKGFSHSAYEQLATGRGRIVFASARPEEKSYLLPGDRNSLFTKHLLAGLRGDVKSDDTTIRVSRLWEYLWPRVNEAMPQQHPIFKGEMEESFPVALYRGGQPATIPTDEQGFEYDAFLSFAQTEPDMHYVWTELVPFLQEKGVRLAIAGDPEVIEPGVEMVIGIPAVMERCKRTLMVLTPDYFDDSWANFSAIVDATQGIEEGKHRLLPLIVDSELDRSKLPAFVRILQPLDLTHPYLGKRNLETLAARLKGPLPGRSNE
ncbi:MAG: caspase family protein [Caldilineaceae bacterium]|nr:caspase family protein [Caldilineaceae bacterium]